LGIMTEGVGFGHAFGLMDDVDEDKGLFVWLSSSYSRRCIKRFCFWGVTELGLRVESWERAQWVLVYVEDDIDILSSSTSYS
jgi:hypothetical protein